MGRAETAELVESGSNHMGQEPVGVPLVELLPMYLELRAGSEIGASGGGPEHGGSVEGVLVAQPVLQLGAASDSSLAKAPPDGRVIGRGRWDGVGTRFVLSVLFGRTCLLARYGTVQRSVEQALGGQEQGRPMPMPTPGSSLRWE
ncbi:hypothetical protein INS49_011108 [Diaporthe citri]|uniref:uncharacterized protein n=1 Tax=Diaporthe citri TaxID=83186 RepID=UPI001C7FC0FC|nr:uncharacterized protein INS49_011108 [Diaporthe citri]KAG6360052.1 hypothetical protein INS49_011108 [Diaporthe citri]